MSKKEIKIKRSKPKTRINQDNIEFKIGEFSVDTITVLSDLESYDRIVLRINAMFVMIVLCVQIRLAHSKESSTFIEKLPSFRFYKRKGLLSANSLLVASAVCIIEIYSFIKNDYDREYAKSSKDSPSLEQYLQNFIEVSPDTYEGNHKKIASATQTNFAKYKMYRMTRFMGIINGSISTNISLLGLTSSVVDLSIEDVMSNIKLQPKPSIDQVKNLVKKELFGEIPPSNKTFNEPHIVCKIEKEILGDIIIRTQLDALIDKMNPNEKSNFDIKGYLDSRELILMKHYQQMGKTDKVKELTNIAIEREKSKKGVL